MRAPGVAAAFDDPGIPALHDALRADVVLPILARVTGVAAADLPDTRLTTEPLSHKSAQRCTLRYVVTADGAAGGRRTVIAKVYRRKVLAQRIHDYMSALRAEAFDGRNASTIPHPLGVVPELGLALQEHLDGDDLRHPLIAGAAETPLRVTARWLADLHRANAISGLKGKSRSHELDKVDAALLAVGPHLPSRRRADLERLAHRLRRLGAGGDGCAGRMIHRDFYYAHVLCRADGIGVIDFDSLSIGDPALDVGHFLAHLEALGYRRAGDPDRFADGAGLFLESYLEAAPADVRSGVAFFKTYTHVKLAAIEVFRRSGEWRTRAGDYIDLAIRSAEAS